jgi:uncharacterized membrane protein
MAWHAGSVAAVVLGGLCIAMLVSVYNHRENAKAIVLSFLEFELMIAAECLLDLWDMVGKRAGTYLLAPVAP